MSKYTLDIGKAWKKYTDDVSKKKSDELAAKYGLTVSTATPQKTISQQPAVQPITLSTTHGGQRRQQLTYAQQQTLRWIDESEVANPVFPDEPLRFASLGSRLEIVGAGYDQRKQLCVGFRREGFPNSVIVWKPVGEFLAWFVNGECYWLEEGA